jgi:plasmid maintenance system antidote protein VapI/Zn-dependent peptidase ImmA (M78 family)
MKIDAFEPNWASPPGETINDLLEERDIPLSEFAALMGATDGQITELLSGRTRISNEIALKLSETLGAPAKFWLDRDFQFREDLDRIASDSGKEEDWLSELPIKDMRRFGWIQASKSRTDVEEKALEFFDVPDANAWREKYGTVVDRVAFRTSYVFSSNAGAVAAWLRQGEIESEAVVCKPWNATKFKQVLQSIRTLTREKNPAVFIPALKESCAECGVAVCIVRAPSGCRASGATRFISEDKAVLLLSFRYLSDDHFWFTFFHEAGHLVLHGKDALFLEGAKGMSTREEHEANQFAADVLIPAEAKNELLTFTAQDWRQIVRFSKQIGISTGIVVGQLQHLGKIRPNQLNKLKTRYRWSSE